MKVKALILALAVFTVSCKKTDTKPEEPAVVPSYTNFKILSVKVTAMPFIDGNTTSWDPFDGPDVYFNMEDQNSNILFNGSSSRFNDINTNSLPLLWNFVNAHQITNLNVTHFVTLYDYDTLDPNDLIGYVGFTMIDHKSGYPKEVTKTSGSITITINGEWY